MRKFFLALSFLFFQTPFAADASEPLPKLAVRGNQIIEAESGQANTLRGVSLCSLEWHKPLEQIKQLTDEETGWKANVIRLPVQVREWDRVGSEQYMKTYLDPAVKLCEEKGIYCIIDWHEISAWDDKKKIDKLRSFWHVAAPRYGNNPNILFEVFNEPTSPGARTKENWTAFKKTVQPLIDLIRVYAPETVILVGSPHWSQMPSFAVDYPFRGENLVYVMHVYPNWDVRLWDKLFGDASAHIPIFLSEWGWSSHEKTKGEVIHGSLESYGKPLREYVDAHPSISWTAWSYDPLCGPAMLGVDKDMANFVESWLESIQK